MDSVFDSLEQFLSKPAALAKGPVGLILAEDATEIASTLRHHLDLGFRALVCFMPAELPAPDLTDPRITLVRAPLHETGIMSRIINSCSAAAAPGTWFYWCYNAEYLFFPFCENRSIGELASFLTEERRDAALTYVVDLYAGDLNRHPDAVSLENAHLDRTGYYALARRGADDSTLERQLNFFGGLRWRFEEHVPARRRRIDRISIFRNQRDLRISEDGLFNISEYNTYACPWHNSPTAAICSFRTAKALKRNPGSSFDIHSFMWHNSAPMEWHSRQLLDLGLMEPGQWF